MSNSRRTFLAQALAGAGLLTLGPAMAASAPNLLIPNVTGLYAVKVANAMAPTTTAEVAGAVRSWPGKVAIGGGRYTL